MLRISYGIIFWYAVLFCTSVTATLYSSQTTAITCVMITAAHVMITLLTKALGTIAVTLLTLMPLM